MRLYRIAQLQIQHYRRQCYPNAPEWYETRRKTSHVIFWST